MSLLLSRNDAQNMNDEVLIKFLGLGLQEGAQIDYKEALSGGVKMRHIRNF